VNAGRAPPGRTTEGPSVTSAVFAPTAPTQSWTSISQRTRRAIRPSAISCDEIAVGRRPLSNLRLSRFRKSGF
jgi:hypothetical protein